MLKSIFILLSVTFTAMSCVTIKTQRTVAIDYYNLGNEYFTLGKYKEASDAYSESLNYDDKNAKAILNLILSYQKQNNHTDAEKLIIKEYNRRFSGVDKEQLLILLGNNYFHKKEFELAEKTFLLFTDTYPSNERGWFNLGLTYLKLGNSEKALENFLNSYKKKNNFAPAIYNIASYYYGIEDIKQSLFFYKKLSSLSEAKDDPEVYYRLGLIEFKRKEFELARDRISQAIAKDNTNPDYYIALARVYAEGYKNKNKSLENLEKAFENNYKDFSNLNAIEEFKILKNYQEYEDLIEKYKQ
jgi:tetratricopeptide (TPR) repeat protein